MAVTGKKVSLSIFRNYNDRAAPRGSYCVMSAKGPQCTVHVDCGIPFPFL